MSPSAHFNGDHQFVRREINGVRPFPLKIKKDSYAIQKSASLAAKHSLPPVTHQKRNPVIIYTESPKIIHTKAHDFMALVQKLTGLSRCEGPQPQTQLPEASEGNDHAKIEDASSSITVENYDVGDAQVSSPYVSQGTTPPSSFFSDIPPFTPNSSEFFCSPQHFYRYPDSIYTSPKMGSCISPSFMEILKTIPEY